MDALYIIFGFLSPWLIWHSYLFYFLMVDDKSFNLVIISQAQLNKYWAYILSLLVISVYIFLIRLNNTRREIKVSDISETFSNLVKELSWMSLFGLLIFFILLLIFWIMFTRVILHYLKQCILALYLYHFQYNYFRNMCYWLVHRQTDYALYLIRRVNVFTNNPKITNVSWILWPWTFELIKRNLYIFLIPYLIIFDFTVQNGSINKIFILLPWFYLYSLLKAFLYMFDKLFNRENHDLSEEIYGLH